MKSYKDLIKFALQNVMDIQVEHEIAAYPTVLKFSNDLDEIMKAIELNPVCTILFREGVTHRPVGWASLDTNRVKTFVIYSTYLNNHLLYPKKGFIDNWINDLPNAHKLANCPCKDHIEERKEGYNVQCPRCGQWWTTHSEVEMGGDREISWLGEKTGAPK